MDTGVDSDGDSDSDERQITLVFPSGSNLAKVTDGYADVIAI